MFGKLKALLGLGDDAETAEAKRRMQIDAADPRRRFVFGLLAMSYELDPAYLIEHGRTAICEWYGIESPHALRTRIQSYLDGTGSTPAYDLFRAAFLARAGQAAAMVNEAESWDLALACARKAQAAYPSWDAYGHGYLEGHLAYRQSQGDDASTLAGYRANIQKRIANHQRGCWAATPFHTPL